MSLRGYVKRTKPALWRSVAGGMKPRVAAPKPPKAKPDGKAMILRRDAKRQADYAKWRLSDAKGRAKDAKPGTQNIVAANRPRQTVNPVSTIRAVQLREYRRTVKAWKALPENRMCRFPGGCDRPTSDNHHLRGKIGALLNDQRFWCPLCRAHHDWVRDHPIAARALGLLPPVGQWNTSPEQYQETLDRNATLIQRGQDVHSDRDADGLHPNGQRRQVAANEFGSSGA